MLINNLSLSDFKNYESVSLDLSPGINCFIGNNGAGKTNILDAIYYLAFCKSFFNPTDSMNIRHGQPFFAVHGDFSNEEEKVFKVSCAFKRGSKKVFKYNKKEYDRLADHIGKIPLVMVSPYDQNLITGLSELRRKFMDGVISQFNGLYLSLLIDYQKVLSQRNALLRSFAERGFYDSESIDVWNDQLIQLGSAIYDTRKAFIEDFADIFQFYYEKIADSSEKVKIEYKSDFHEADFKAILEEGIEKDRQLRYTSKGVHRDDLKFYISGYPVRKFGSQGQQKSFTLAVKLAQYEWLRREKKITPILLLDDIFDKLDTNRVEKILSLVEHDLMGQVFVTDTNLNRIDHLFQNRKMDYHIFNVEQASINKLSRNEKK